MGAYKMQNNQNQNSKEIARYVKGINQDLSELNQIFSSQLTDDLTQYALLTVKTIMLQLEQIQAHRKLGGEY